MRSTLTYSASTSAKVEVTMTSASSCAATAQSLRKPYSRLYTQREVLYHWLL